MPQFFMDPQSGRIVDEYGQLVDVPPGTVATPIAPPVQPTAASGGWLLRDIGGVPLWGVLLGVGGVIAGGYYLVTRAQAKVNEGDGDGSSSSGDDDETPKLEANAPSTRRRSSWSPSRARVAERAKKWLSSRGKVEGVTIYSDADEALEKGVKNPSPLINFKVRRNAKLHEDGDFKKWARREGLNPVRIDQTTIGLVPAENTKRGGAWESYVDALREEGQKV